LEIFHKNVLRQSELGLGDGTIYASGTVNLETDISQANSTFTLTGFTLDALTGTDTDDLMNGYLLYFPVSGNKYHVVDWVASTDTATTHEMPQITDTGACEFRKALFDNNALASNPLLYAADGRKDKAWDASINNPTIEIYLPNAIDNGGFEGGALAPWSDIKIGGVSTDYTALAEVSQPELNAGDGYQSMSALTITDATGATFYVFFEALITTGNDFWAWNIEKNSTSIQSGGWNVSLHPESTASPHVYTKYRMKLTGLINSDVINIKMKASDINGDGIGSGGTQTLFLKNLIISSDASEINSASQLVGNFDYFLTLGGRTQRGIAQIIDKLKKATTYRILFKAKSTSGFIQGQFCITIAGNPGLDLTLTAPSSGNLSGTHIFQPALTTTAAWHWVDISTPSWDVTGSVIQVNILDGAFDVNVDEIYIFEKINVSSLILTEQGSGYTNITSITGRNVSLSRTGATDPIVMSSPGIITRIPVEFTPLIRPVYSIEFTFSDSIPEILLGEKWQWEFNPDMPFDADAIEYDEKTIKSRSGVESIVRHSKKRTIKGKYSKMSAIERAILKNDFFPNHIDEERHPFAYRLNQTDTPLFVRVSQSKFGLNRSSGLRDDWDFAFDEVL